MHSLTLNVMEWMDFYIALKSSSNELLPATTHGDKLNDVESKLKAEDKEE